MGRNGVALRGSYRAVSCLIERQQGDTTKAEGTGVGSPMHVPCVSYSQRLKDSPEPLLQPQVRLDVGPRAVGLGETEHIHLVPLDEINELVILVVGGLV